MSEQSQTTIRSPKSSGVSIFPLAKNRPVSDRSSRILYEKNIANIIKQIIDVDGFVISDSISLQCGEDSNNPDNYAVKFLGDLEFNLLGYYFKLTSQPEGATEAPWLEMAVPKAAVVGEFTSGTIRKGVKLYASISISNNEINGQDDNGSYEGLKFGLSNDFITEDVKLLLGEMVFRVNLSDSDSDPEVSWNTESESKLKFNLDSFGKSIKFIDGAR